MMQTPTDMAAQEASEPVTFRRSYRFPAMQPFAVVHRAAQLDSQLLLECNVENVTKKDIFLTSWRLDCAEGFDAAPVGDAEAPAAQGGAPRRSTMHRLRPQGSRWARAGCQIWGVGGGSTEPRTAHAPHLEPAMHANYGADPASQGSYRAGPLHIRAENEALALNRASARGGGGEGARSEGGRPNIPTALASQSSELHRKRSHRRDFLQRSRNPGFQAGRPSPRHGVASR